jgi:metal-responsive CopG/Arc/MetJ family transcriptional regulator
MSSVSTHAKKERLSFAINSDLSEKINEISNQTNLSVSEIARQALQIFIEQKEKEEIEKELEAGYKSNYGYYLKSHEDWKYADNE